MQATAFAKNFTKNHPFESAIAIGLILLYLPLIVHWYDGWLNKNISIEHEYFSHGLIGLPFSAYIAWNNRKQWQALPDRFNPIGAVLLGLSAVFYFSSLWDLVNSSFPIMLAGLCLILKGWQGLKLQLFALLMVFLASPTNLPYLISPYTLPLQKFIAGTAGFILTQFGLNVDVRGILLFVNDRIVEVAPHCSGLKMLFTTIYVALMLLYWTGANESRKTIVVFLMAAMTLSVWTNIFRNTALTFFHGTGRDGLFHWMHESWGGDMISAVMLLLLIPILNLLEWLRSAFSGPEVQEDL